MLISWLASLEVQEDSKDLKDVQSRFPLANDHEKLISYLLLVDTVKKFKSMSFQGCWGALTVKFYLDSITSRYVHSLSEILAQTTVDF